MGELITSENLEEIMKNLDETDYLLQIENIIYILKKLNYIKDSNIIYYNPELFPQTEYVHRSLSIAELYSLHKFIKCCKFINSCLSKGSDLEEIKYILKDSVIFKIEQLFKYCNLENIYEESKEDINEDILRGFRSEEGYKFDFWNTDTYLKKKIVT